MSTGRSSRSAGNDARSDARERALHLLYEAHAKSASGSSVVESQVLAVDDLVLEIVAGVDGVTAQADEIIADNANADNIPEPSKPYDEVYYGQIADVREFKKNGSQMTK